LWFAWAYWVTLICKKRSAIKSGTAATWRSGLTQKARTVIPISKASTVRVLDLFAGIGGFTLGLERAGFETVAFCEIDPYAQKVLKKNWPGVPIYDDVRTITAERLASDGIGVDVITGGFPCQDISVSGNRAGIQDGTRSGLWSECARLLGELRPQYAIFENVTNLLNGERGAWFKRVLWDISQIGYDAEWHCIPASELGAHHHRDRIWIIAYPRCKFERDNGKLAKSQAKRTQGAIITTTIRENVANTDCAQRERGCLSSGIRAQYANISGASGWEVESDVGRVANGIPARSHRLKCLGNAVVPPIPELIGRAINGHR
jgi:DNA (cytosine-5)-methyltransferase 1